MRTPDSAQSAWSASSACGSPETTTEAGLFTAATVSRPSQRRMRSSAWSTGSATDTMPPVPASSASAWLRSATTRAASDRVRAPRDAGRGDLALRVSRHGVGADAVGLPECGERHHDGEEDRLDDVDPVEAGSARLALQHVEQ
ncbi:hypothetical protein GCM10020295_15220 [Streptomyces cinereospinus]